MYDKLYAQLTDIIHYTKYKGNYKYLYRARARACAERADFDNALDDIKKYEEYDQKSKFKCNLNRAMIYNSMYRYEEAML
jgi:hypothetical protein